MTSSASLSVVVTVLDGALALERSLCALARQEGVAPFEILVPFDSTIDDVGALAAAHPSVTFLPMGHLATRHPASTAAGRHELYDLRRSAGLARARGSLVALLGDRCIARPDWARTALRLHAEQPHAVIGGAVECASVPNVDWPTHFCDFGRYQAPFRAAVVPYVTDLNVCYKRRALDATRELWCERYHETTLHWALIRRGESLYLSPELVVEHVRLAAPLREALNERFHWGRLFAYTRAREASLTKRIAYASVAPFLPVVLFLRQARLQLGKRVHLRRFVLAAPRFGAFLVFWCAGELWGYLTGKP